MQRFKVTFRALMAPFLVGMPELLPGSAWLGLIEAASKAGGVVWPKSHAALQEIRNSKTFTPIILQARARKRRGDLLGSS
jgi:hypothetical protein